MDQVSIVYGNFSSETLTKSPIPPTLVVGISEVFTNEHLKNGTYGEYKIDHRYSTDTGLRVFPKAASGESGELCNSVVRVHNGITDLTIVFTCERRNAKPLLPKIDTGDPNEVPIRQEITFANKLQLTQGNTIYRVSGVYYYKLLKPKGPNDKYPIGTTPAEISPSAANFFEPADFSDRIIDAAFANPGVNLKIPIRVGT